VDEIALVAYGNMDIPERVPGYFLDDAAVARLLVPDTDVLKS